MILIRPYYKILSPLEATECNEILCAIEQAGRTCYKSEDKLITPATAAKFVRMIIEQGHESVLEHISIRVKFVCDRGVTHEIVRHRIASYSQESTRYCNYSKDKFGNQVTFILPCWFKTIGPGEYHHFAECYKKNTVEAMWIRSMTCAENDYLRLIEEGWSPQQARSVLPNALKTEIVMTANLREWRHFFRLRTSPKAHPQMRELAVPLLNTMRVKLPSVFWDVEMPADCADYFKETDA